MGNRRLGILITLFLICASSVIATDFVVDIDPVKDKIASNESAVFELSIDNFGKDDRFSLSSKDPRWSLLTVPLTHFTSGVPVEANGTSDGTTIYLKPVGLSVGKYKVGFEISSRNTGETQEELLDIEIGSYAAGQPVIRTGLELVPAVTLPGNKISIKVNLENQNTLNMQGLSLKIVSDLVSAEEKFDLAALEEKTLELTADIDASAEAKEYNIKAIITRDNEIVGQTEAILSVLTSLPEFKKEVISSTGFLKAIDELTVTNDGNARIAKTVTMPASTIKRWFTSAEPDFKVVKQDGKRLIGWDVDLKAGESMRIVITRDYKTFTFAVVLIFALIAAYFVVRPSVYAKKTAMKISKKEGGIGELNILLKVKNRSNKTIQDVMVEDSIPKIAELVKEEYVGTLAPASIFRHETRGTVMRWELGNLEPKEERLLRYRLKSRISILGSFNLPKIKVKYVQDEKPVTIYSRKKRIVG